MWGRATKIYHLQTSLKLDEWRCTENQVKIGIYYENIQGVGGFTIHFFLHQRRRQKINATRGVYEIKN